jgi:gluconate 5-dehydrogenase
MQQQIQDLFDLRGRIALCTGASSGIGQHMALVFAKAGADVVLAARNERALNETAENIRNLAGVNVATVVADLGDRSVLGSVVEQATGQIGSPDILLNAAGINLREPFDQITDESWNRTLDINLSTPFFLARNCVPGMKAKGYGSIINIASLQSYRAFPNSMAYGATKGGIAQLTRAMAEAWSKDGIIANAIAPGFFPTELTRKVYENPEMLQHNARMTAIGRNGELSDLDGVAVFLASKAASYITGQVISVDGGFTAK